MADYTILITDKSLVIQGDPIVDWTSLDVTLRFNEPGSGMFIVPALPYIRDQIAPGCRIVVIRDDEVLIAGPMEKYLYERGDDGEKAGDGTLTIDFADDLAKVVARQVYPDPTLAPASQVTDHWTYTGNAELALRDLVNLNAGPGALTDRKISNLILGSLASVGSSITVSADRMQPMGELMRLIASIGGEIGFRTRQSETDILFEVYQPEDKSGEVRFGFGLGNLKYIAQEVSAPTATAAIVGGQGEGADRFVLERVNSSEQTSWGRYETLVNQAGSKPTAELEDDGDQALAAGASTTRIPTNVSDTPDQRYGVHYGLGTKVSVETGPGEQFSDIVKTVHIQAWATAGEYIASTIGSQAAQTDPLWVQSLRQIDERLGKLERRVVPASA